MTQLVDKADMAPHIPAFSLEWFAAGDSWAETHVACMHSGHPSEVFPGQLGACKLPYRLWDVFQRLDHFSDSPLDTLQQFSVSPILSTPHVDTVLQVRS